MNIKQISTAVLGLSLAVLPSIASAHTILGETVHLDLSASSDQIRSVGVDSTNVSGVSAHLYSQIRNRTMVYVDGTQSFINVRGAGNVNGNYNALTGFVGVTQRIGNNWDLDVKGGNVPNATRLFTGYDNRTVPFVGVSLTNHVF